LSGNLPLRILVVDDNPGDAALIRLQLEGLPGYEMTIDVASSLTKALELVASTEFEVTFLDLGLPECQGSETYSQFRVKFPAGTIIVLSGDTDDGVALTTVREGAQDFLVKGQYDGHSLHRVLSYSLERQRIEADLRNREARWASLVAAVPVEITELDLEGRVLFSNGHLGALGIPASPGDLWTHGFDAVDRPRAAAFLKSGRATVDPEPMASRHDLPDREVFLVHRLSAVRDSGMVKSLLVATSDVTASVERDARVGKDLLVQKTLNSFSSEDSADSLYHLVLSAFLTLTGSTAGAICEYQEQEKFIPRAEAGQTPASGWAPFGDGEPARVVVHDRGAPVLVVLLSGKHRPYTEEDLALVSQLARDLWLHLARRREDTARKELLDAIVKLPLGFAVGSTLGTLGFSNPRFTELMGLQAQESQDIDYADQFPGGRNGPLFRTMAQSLATEGQWLGEVLVPRGGTECLLEFAVYVLVGDHRKPNYAVFVDDITQKRTTERFLAKARKMTGVGQMAAGMAHDLNNVLSIILSYSQLLQLGSPVGAPGSEFTHKIEMAAQRASGMVSRLLDYGRGSGKGFERVELSGYLAGEVDLLRSLVSEPVVLKVVLDDSPLPVDLDKELFGQVLMNLVCNSRDALKPGAGEIVVSVRHRTQDGVEWALVEVADTGPGIPREIRSKIFDPFFSTKALGEGTGLGLALVWGVIEQHGARIDVDCPDSGGTRFTVSLKVRS